jgi:dehydrogenase/reductase SDR family member 12
MSAVAKIGPRLDKALELSVIGGYSRLGYQLRSAAWRSQPLARMDGETVLITGASSGLGLAAADGFAGLAARVYMLARDRERGERARDQVAQKTGNPEVRALICDLSDLRAVRLLARQLCLQAPRLDVLVNNAGVLTRERTLSAQGLELTFATNVLGPFLLTKLLTQRPGDHAPRRIINVSSGGMYLQRLHADDLQMQRERFDGPTAYARTKREQVILTEMWAKQLAGSGGTVHAMHPGWVDTPGLRRSLPRFYKLAKPLLRTAKQGADTILWLGSVPAGTISSGRFWHDRAPRPTHRVPWSRESPADRERLWRECERLSEL